MLKKIIPLLFPISMVACSQDTGVEPVATGSSEATRVGNYRVLPHFTFGEDGSRYSRDAESGKLVKKDMVRSVLVVADEESFDSLKAAYRVRKNENLEYPVDYLCSDELLAINTDYSEVVTKDGKVLLNDASLLAGCRNISVPDYLMKRYESSDFRSYREIRKGQLVIIAESKINCYPSPDSHITGQFCEPLSKLSVYIHDYKEDCDVLIDPAVAAIKHVVFNPKSCKDAHGSSFSCDQHASYNDYNSPNHPAPLQLGANMRQEKFPWVSADQAGAVAIHAVWFGSDDEFYLKTAVNADQALATRIYNTYLLNLL